MFSEAYEEVRRWDDDAAVHYKWNGGQALKNDGDMRGLNEPLRTSSVAHTVALELAPRVTRPADWAGLQNNPGNVYLALTERVGDGTSLELAIDAFHATLEVSQRETAPGDWAMAQNDLGVALVDRSLSRDRAGIARRGVGDGTRSADARGCAARLGYHAEQSGDRAQGSGRPDKADRADRTRRRDVPGGAGGQHTGDDAARMGHGAMCPAFGCSTGRWPLAKNALRGLPLCTLIIGLSRSSDSCLLGPDP